MIATWDHLTGARIAGRYTLEKLLGSDGRRARWIVSVPGRAPGTTLLETIPAASPGASERLNQWRFGRTLSHPHLLRVLDTDRAEADGVPVIYLVTESPDEVLATVLRERLLTATEARGILSAAAGALMYLHGRGLVLGDLSPATVLALGDTIKFPVDSVRRPFDEGAAEAEDLRALGLTLCEVLTGRRDASRLALDCVPTDLAAIIRGCLQPEISPRQTLEELAAEVGIGGGVPAEPAQSSRWNFSALARVPVWIYPAAAVGIALFAGLVARGPSKPEPHPAPRPAPVAAPVHPRPSLPAIEVPRPSPMPAPARVVGRSSDERHVWRVVVYTYAAREAAEKMANHLREKWPAWNPEAFSPGGGAWLVAIGGRMTRDEALRLQRKARTSGLPRDTFARNFPR